MTLFRSGSRNKLKLSARLPRPSYFAGQRCYVHVQILNDTRKTVRSLRLILIRTTTVYRPRSRKGNRKEEDDNDHVSGSSYQSKAFTDEISESRLAMAEPATRMCASSKGWWAGVSPQERTAFTHDILIPVRPYSGINYGLVGSFELQLSSARCTVNGAHRTHRCRSCHSYHRLRIGWYTGINFAFVRYAPYPCSVYAICGSPDRREPSVEHDYGYPHQQA